MSINDGYSSTSAPSPDETTAKFDRSELVRGWREYEARIPRVVPVLKYAAKTDMGQVRENNEDKFDYYEPEDPAILAARGSLFLVADGIGGAQAGQIASEMLVKSLIAGYYDHPAGDIQTAIYEALVATNDRIHSLAQMIPERSGMGSTLTAVVFVEDRVVVAQVGDSRAYLIRDGEVRQVTQDHSWVEEQVRAGMLSREDAEMSPFRNVITRSVGASPSVQPDFYVEESRVGDTWVLCSDGLTGHVQAGEIGQIAASHPPSEAARQLIELANARGGRDNITVFILSVRDLIPLPEMPANGRVESAALSPEEPAEGKNAAAPIREEAGEAARGGWRKLFGRA
ncbi:MAG TPA: Stp1/IreP family PP2C-type Ser/Thr phosphatase [Chthonomonadaceae bacterium]|nr:Stp1/IreP family PP2C-type Ser/Thr phosphatase [Chthonomonadaceae bacterium]